jgi:protein subunit release factor A
MTTNIEVRAGDGGDDAALFARELAEAIAAYLHGELVGTTEVQIRGSL